jgi:rubrerythrin
MVTSTFMDAIRVAKENERIASESYAEASKKLVNYLAKDLFVHLSEFEKFHLEKLTALEKSLQESGEFIQYEGKEFPLPPAFEITAAKEPETKSAMQVITEARELETRMQDAYTALAAMAPEGSGKDMFNRLAGEERKHFFLLNEAWWSLSDNGTWKWSLPA